MMTAAPKQSVVSRIFWFIVGGLISTGLNAGPFRLLQKSLGLSTATAYAISLTFVTVLFSVWNYRINFRTQRGWRECLVRYIGAVGGCALLNYSIVIPALKWWHAGWFLIIATVQVGMGGVKFLLYHFWVYPRPPHPPTAAEVVGAQ